ncbi:phenazine biosynthesis protein PhzF family [Salinarchaeum sp. Harcht-Bsk1]|uniref:PhzF family phenazine biosynthesis protein n=1 Tax=Salinarchaeum sp. Harcht-Bsk1 TaxID=1333523 RepID=UPI0003423AB2|nr:PhzF family phenazine biosynthesis protein [Salinarchaeum sp. Harcht-Bsk1]AGN02315.1 phenazine biosynthesis protein PhzF family [Salinarchaeum sp. Harcht-Bsk1]
MQTVRTLLVDAFTDEPLSGNAAGVVPDAAGLSEPQRQAIARELSVSETAFLANGDGADYRIQYFTPTQPVDLCGHATIGTFAGLAATDAIGAGTVEVETPVGVLEVTVEDDGSVWMTQDDPTIRRVDLDRERLAAALGLRPSAVTDLESELPLAVSSTGLPWLLVPVAFLSQLGDADPDLDAVAEIADEVDAVGIYPFTFDTLEREAHVHARAFAPGAGVPEDPVTGTASGATGAFLRHVGAFDGDLPEELLIEQGHYVERPGTVRVRAGEKIRVGGNGALALDGELRVPEMESDDILEA